MGRNRSDPTKAQISASIDAQCRTMLKEWGLTRAQIKDALDYINRGYTMEAAAKLAIAGGDTSAVLDGRAA
jgi:hypothetical protein